MIINVLISLSKMKVFCRHSMQALVIVTIDSECSVSVIVVHKRQVKKLYIPIFNAAKKWKTVNSFLGELLLRPSAFQKLEKGRQDIPKCVQRKRLSNFYTEN